MKIKKMDKFLKKAYGVWLDILVKRIENHVMKNTGVWYEDRIEMLEERLEKLLDRVERNINKWGMDKKCIRKEEFGRIMGRQIRDMLDRRNVTGEGEDIKKELLGTEGINLWKTEDLKEVLRNKIKEEINLCYKIYSRRERLPFDINYFCENINIYYTVLKMMECENGSEPEVLRYIIESLEDDSGLTKGKLKEIRRMYMKWRIR